MDPDIAALLGGDDAARDKDERVSEARLARLFGVSPRTVRELARKAIIQRAPVGGYHLGASVAAYCAHLREAAAARSETGTLAAERLRLTRERADEAALKNARLRGGLLDAGEVEREWSDVLRTVRARVLAVSARISEQRPEMSRDDAAMIDAELRAALTELGEEAP